jgi:hypothetical protein
VWYHPASSKFYLTILFPLSFSGKLTGTLSGFIARVKPAPSGLLCAWREVPILRQQHAYYLEVKPESAMNDSEN